MLALKFLLTERNRCDCLNSHPSLLSLIGVKKGTFWCEKGHIGYVLSGELEIDFNGEIVKYIQGAGICIPTGTFTKHKARAITPSVQLFLVEDL